MKISVVVPSHNCADTIRETLASVVQQRVDFDAVQIVLVDDRSTDGKTRGLLDELAQEFGDVLVLDNQGQQGPSAARNTGVKAASHEWIAFLDSDDVLLPGSLKARASALESFPDAKFIAADFHHWWPDGRRTPEEGFYAHVPVGARALKQAIESRKPMRLDAPVEVFMDAVLCWTGANLIHKSALETVGGFDESLVRFEDDSLWIRLAERYGYVFVPEIVSLYRQREGSLTRSGEAPAEWGVLAYSKLAKEPRLAPWKVRLEREIAGFADANAYFYRQQKEWGAALRSSWQSIAWGGVSVARFKNFLAALIHKG